MRWFKRSADTPHLTSLSPLKNDEQYHSHNHQPLPQPRQYHHQQYHQNNQSYSSMHPAVLKSGEVGSRNEFLSVPLGNAMAATTTKAAVVQLQCDVVKRNDSDSHSRKENRRDWRRSYSRNTVNCYSIQEGRIIDGVKIRDRSLSPNFLRRKKNEIIDVRRIFETTKTKDYQSPSSQEKGQGHATIRSRVRNHLVKERRNPLPTTRLSFCETKLTFDDTTDTYQPYNLDTLNCRIKMLDMSSTSSSPTSRNVATRYTNQCYTDSLPAQDKTKVSSTNNNNNSRVGIRSKSVEDFTKEEDMLIMNKINKPENKFKTLSGKTQKFLSSLYRARFDKNATIPTATVATSPKRQGEHFQKNNKIITDHLTVTDDLNSGEWNLLNDYRSTDNYLNLDSHFIMTDADSGILENDSGQSSLNSIPVAAENAGGAIDIKFTAATADTSRTSRHYDDCSNNMLNNSDFLVTVVCDANFKDFSKHLYHCKGSYFITNLIVKKIRLLDGRCILPGDEILEICRVPIQGKSYIEVYNLLQNIQANSQYNYVGMVLRRVSENDGINQTNGSNSSGSSSSVNKRNGIRLHNLDSGNRSFDYAVNAIRIDGTRTKTKPPTELQSSQRKLVELTSSKGHSVQFQKNIPQYGSITRRLIRRSVLGRLTATSVMDVSEATSNHDEANAETASLNNDTESINSEGDATKPTSSAASSSSNFFTLPRKSKVGLYSFHTICFEKGTGKKSLGFTIVGGRDSPKGAIGIFVKRILNSGQAVDDGRLRVGDEILSVNGQVCHDLSHEEAVKLFKSIRSGEIVLRICRREKQSAVKDSNSNSRNEKNT